MLMVIMIENMQGPFMEDKAEQRLSNSYATQRCFFRRRTCSWRKCSKRYKKSFSLLKGRDQDKILSDFEKGKIQTTGFKSSYFFTFLRDMTVAGVLADPIYGGNDNKNGWRMM